MTREPSRGEPFLDELTDRVHAFVVLVMTLALSAAMSLHDLVVDRLR